MRSTTLRIYTYLPHSGFLSSAHCHGPKATIANCIISTVRLAAIRPLLVAASIPEWYYTVELNSSSDILRVMPALGRRVELF